MKSHTPSGRNSSPSNRLTKLFRGLLLKSWSGSKNWLCERLCEDAVKLVKSPNLDFIIKCQKEPGSGSSTCIRIALSAHLILKDVPCGCS
jgi:hypothetical protein